MVPQPGRFPALDVPFWRFILLTKVVVTKSLFYLISALSDSIYLPNGKSYRIIFVPQTRTSGSVSNVLGRMISSDLRNLFLCTILTFSIVRLLTWPTHVQGRNQQPLPEEPYEIVSGPRPDTFNSNIGVTS